MNKTLIGILIAILGIAIIWFFVSQNNEASDSEVMSGEVSDENAEMEGGATNEESNNDGATTPQNSVTLAPTETGKTVVVQEATLTTPGYVVIYQVNSNNDTSVIGQSDLLPAGEYSNLEIQLDSIVAREQTVVAVLHADDGDGEFEFPEADFYLGNSNDPIVSDVDVVDVDQADEDEVLQANVEAFLEANL